MGAGGISTLKVAETSAEYEAYGALCRAYVGWCRQRYHDMPWFIDEVFGYQSIDAEMKDLAAKYGPPNGRTILAALDGEFVAGGAYWRIGDGVCEMKRLFVADRARGMGMGRKLTGALIRAAKDDGFGVMRLDTGDRLAEAIAMYESLGFRKVPPYQSYPERLMPHLVFMERGL